jgi:hypothetical protein
MRAGTRSDIGHELAGLLAMAGRLGFRVGTVGDGRFSLEHSGQRDRVAFRGSAGECTRWLRSLAQKSR